MGNGKIRCFDKSRGCWVVFYVIDLDNISFGVDLVVDLRS